MLLATGTQVTAKPMPDSSVSPVVSTAAIAGGIVGGLAVVCASIVAVVYLLRRGKAREASDAVGAAQATAAEMGGSQEYKPHVSYHGVSQVTTRKTSVVSELPDLGIWQGISELPADHHEQHHSGFSRT